jgi:cytosine/adenosine deaminase-related metal-dependent hydrolase
MILRARVVLPISGAPIPDGAVVVRGNRVFTVQTWRDLAGSVGGKGRKSREEVVDLGDVILLPGLVNAHCHLDYTNMAGQLPPPKHFTDWLKAITELKSGWDYSDYADSWMNGAQMLVRTGTTTVADIEAVPELLPAAWESTPLRVVSQLEMIGITNRRLPEALLEDVLKKVSSLPNGHCQVGLSPHAPYSTLPKLLRLSASAVRSRNCSVAVHIAESAPEYAMFRHRTGPMFDWMRKSGRDMSDCGLGTPLEHVDRYGLLNRRVMAIHLNYLGQNDAQLIARRQAHVVHCPRSHHYFGHRRFALSRLLRAGVNVCLGTDSLASVYRRRGQRIELSMFEEMRALAARFPRLGPRKILEMATLNGAKGLGMAGKIGEISRGAYADLIAVPFRGTLRDVPGAILKHSGAVAASMINGQWAIEPSAP